MRSGPLAVHLVVVVALVVLMSLPACADIPMNSGGILWSHFGVDLDLVTPEHDDYVPYTDGTSATYRIDPYSWLPTTSSTADYVVDDWFGAWASRPFDPLTYVGTRTDASGNIVVTDGGGARVPSAGEPYDVEAIYFDDDDENLYIAIVTSFGPNPSQHEDRYGLDVDIVSGDIALDLGINSEHTDGFSYDYGVDIVDDIRPLSGNATSRTPTTNGTDVYRTQNSDWYCATPVNAIDSFGEYSNFDPQWSGFSATDPLGQATYTDYYLYDYGQLLVGEEALWETYVVEATIPRSILPSIGHGQEIGVGWIEGCRNDAGNLKLVAFSDTPEPTALVLATFALGLVWVRRRRPSDEV